MEMAANLDHEEESEKYSRRGRGQVTLGGLGGSSGPMAARDPRESGQDPENWMSDTSRGIAQRHLIGFERRFRQSAYYALLYHRWLPQTHCPTGHHGGGGETRPISPRLSMNAGA